VRFSRPASEGSEASAPGPLNLAGLDMTRVIEIVAALIASLAFVFFVLRPLIGGLIRGGNPAQPALPAPGGAAGFAALPAPDGGGDSSIDVAEIDGRVRQSSVRKMAEVVNQHPDESVQIIRGWLNNAM
jgi:flagellar M-ring protein FliF